MPAGMHRAGADHPTLCNGGALNNSPRQACTCLEAHHADQSLPMRGLSLQLRDV